MKRIYARIALLGLLTFGGMFALASIASAAVIQSSNSSSGAFASSGGAYSSNRAVVNIGPRAGGSTTLGSLGIRGVNGGSQAQQVGNNRVRVRQVSVARSGDAAAGSQVVGVVGRNAVVQLQNSGSGNAQTGDAIAVNSVSTEPEPVPILLGLNGLGLNGVSHGGQAQQIGNNDVVADQVSVATTGSSVAGSQIVGVVGDGSSLLGSNAAASGFSDSPFRAHGYYHHPSSSPYWAHGFYHHPSSWRLRHHHLHRRVVCEPLLDLPALELGRRCRVVYSFN